MRHDLLTDTSSPAPASARTTKGKHVKPRRIHGALLMICAGLVLSGCSVLDFAGEEEDKPLGGERISILELQKDLEPGDIALEQTGLVAPDPWRNEYWPQVGGYPNHAMQHLALNDRPLELDWTLSIGQEGYTESPLNVQPVIFDGKIFTVDSDLMARAFTLEDRDLLWERSLKPVEEDEIVVPGGLAYSFGVLYATAGYNEALALNPRDGEVIWRAELPAPSRSAPTVMDGRVFITTLDNRLIALNAEDGSVLWSHQGLSETAGIVGTASPAANRDIVVPAFSSGEVIALRVENGSVAWSDNLSPVRRVGGLGSLSDIRAHPVLDKGTVIAISFGGRMAAIDERTGQRMWQREIGSSETPWVAGNHVFVITSSNELVAMGRDNGVIRWIKELPKFEDPDSRSEPIVWTGPVLAGNRLILAGSTGRVKEIAPETGEMINQWDTGAAITIPPFVAGGHLYLLGQDSIIRVYQ